MVQVDAGLQQIIIDLGRILSLRLDSWPDENAMDLEHGLVYPDESTADVSMTEANVKVLEYIDSTFSNIIEQISATPYGRPTIALNRLSSMSQSTDGGWLVNGRCVTYSWPGKSQEEAWRFACVGRMMSEIHRAILAGTVITKREIYYREPELYKRQDTVDRYIDDIAYTCGVSRHDLNVTAGAKGLWAYGEHSEIWTISDGSSDHDKIKALQNVAWVLVVEKEAIFKVLFDTGFHHNAELGAGILVTAKGYPDLMTRHFLHNLSQLLPSRPPMYGLFDGDPDGLDISRCLRIGSKRFIQDKSINLPNLKWIGISLCDIIKDLNRSEACLPLSRRDRKKAQGMLEKPEWTTSGDRCCDTAKGRIALQQMLMLNKKAEIEALESIPFGMSRYLIERMTSRD